MKPFLALLLLTFASVHAAEELTPEIIAKRQIEAMRALDWAQLASYTHPKALAQVKSLFLPIANAAAAAPDNPAAAQMMKTLFGGKSAPDLAGEPSAIFFQTIMTGISNIVPDFKTSMNGMSAEILGHIDEGADLAHVVYRLTRATGEGSSVKIAVTTVEREGNTWKALLNSDLETAARAISARLNNR